MAIYGKSTSSRTGGILKGYNLGTRKSDRNCAKKDRAKLKGKRNFQRIK